MKYFVQLGRERVEVTIDGDGVAIEGETVPARISPVEGTPIRLLTVGNDVHRVQVRPAEGRGRYTLWIEGWRLEVEALDERTRTIRDLVGAGTGPVGPVSLKAPMPGLVVRVLVQPGDTVHLGQGLVVMEAMKMENELRAAGDGMVKAVAVSQGMAVEKGALLVELE